MSTIKHRQQVTGTLAYNIKTKNDTGTLGPSDDTTVVYDGIQLYAESIVGETGPFGLAKPVSHLCTRAVLHETSPLKQAITANVLYGYPIGVVGLGNCGQEVVNPGAWTTSAFMTRVLPYTNGSVGLNHQSILNSFDPSEGVAACMRKIIAPKVDLPLFLLELGELKNLVKGLSLGRLREIGREFRRLKKLPVNGFNDIPHVLYGLKEVASYYLSYEFGLAPLVRDLIAIHKTLATLSQRSRQFMNGGLRIKSVSIPVTIPVTLPSEYISSPPSLRTTATGVTKKGYVTVRYSEYLPQLEGLAAQLEQFSRDFGIRLNSKTVWDHIPFSFLVDWALGIGDYVADVETRLREGTWFEVHQAMYSVRLEYQRFLEVRVPGSDTAGPPYYGPKPWVLQASESIKYYERRLVSDTTLLSIYAGSGLEGKRVYLGSSLALQRTIQSGYGKARGVSARTLRRLRKLDSGLADLSRIYNKGK
jgi:hypothetical protein